MRLLAPDRALRWLLAGVFILTVVTATITWVEAGRGSGRTAWLLGGSLTALAAVGWLVLRRSAADSSDKQAQVAQLQKRIRDISVSQGRFVANIAHEIKTPLTIALAHTDLLLRCHDDPIAVRNHAKSIAADMGHLSNLVESFLRLARPFVEEDTSHHVPVYVHDLVLEVVRRCQPLARDGHVSILPTLADLANGDTALEVIGDSVLLEAMVENLVRNAVRFSPRGARVEIRVLLRDEWVVLQIRDHGAGIETEHVESVFEWFFQAPGVTLKSSGTGLGLAIARRIAEHHGGTISLRNHPLGGCEFEIILPRWLEKPLQAPVSEAPPPVARPA